MRIRTYGGVGAGRGDPPGYPIGPPVMGVNLWGASPLYETGSLKEYSIPNVHSDWQSTRRGQLREGDQPWKGSLRMHG